MHHHLHNLNTAHYMWAGIVFVVSYLIGSFSFGHCMRKCWPAMADPQKNGSCSTGATNILRLGGFLPAIITLIGDTLKGVAVIFLCRHFFPHGQMLVGFAAFGAIFGHIFPFYLGFRGGKGVATTLGTLLAIFWPLAVGLYGVWIVVALLTRYASLASAVTMVAAPLGAYFYFHDMGLTWLTAGMLAVMLGTHRGNIRRLIAGIEPKLHFHTHNVCPPENKNPNNKSHM